MDVEKKYKINGRTKNATFFNLRGEKKTAKSYISSQSWVSKMGAKAKVFVSWDFVPLGDRYQWHDNEHPSLHSPKLTPKTHETLKVGRLLHFQDGICSGAMLVSKREESISKGPKKCTVISPFHISCGAGFLSSTLLRSKDRIFVRCEKWSPKGY